MDSVSVFAPAKINLSLDVVGKKSNGYHLLSTVMQSIDLADRITVRHQVAGQGITIRAGHAKIPRDSRNTAWRAAKAFIDASDIAGQLVIDIKKAIPAAAGLGGGSADAAAVLFALNRLFPSRLESQALFGLAAEVGADVPFCLQGGTVLCEGIGEILTPLKAWKGLFVLLVKPPFGMSTPWVFSRFDLDHPGKRPHSKAVLDAIAEQKLEDLAANTANVLESVSLKARPVLADIRTLLSKQGAVLAMMSGSGPTVFGLFDSQKAWNKAEKAVRQSLDSDYLVFRARTLSTGPTLLAE